MDLSHPTKTIVINKSKNLYKWSKIFNRLQMNFFKEETKLRREKQIEDFIYLNEFKSVMLVTDTDVFGEFKNTIQVTTDPTKADIVIITDQKFSRYPCPDIINRIIDLVDCCPNLYLCLNRHYINIDNSYIDINLAPDFPLAITQWLVKELPAHQILDLSLNYLDRGDYFTWAIPDRHYLIRKND